MTRRAPLPGPRLGWFLLFLSGAVALVAPAFGQDEGAAVGEGEALDADVATAEAAAAEAAVAEAAVAEAAAAEAAALEAAQVVLRGTHIGELAMRTRTTLRNLRPLLRASDEVAAIETLLPSIELDIERAADPAHLALITHISQRELAELGQQWLRHQTTFEGWQRALSDRGEALEQVRVELVELRRTWAALRDASNALGRPEGRHERIIESLDAVRAAGDDLDARRDVVTSLQDRVSELVIVTEDVSDQIHGAAAAFRERLFIRDRLPLWSGLGVPPRSGPPPPDADGGAPDAGGAAPEASAEPASASATDRVRAEFEMVAQQLSKAGRLGAFFVVLALAMVALMRRSTGWTAESLSMPRAVAQRPISVALLGTLFVTPLALTHAPILFYDILALASLVPLVRLLPSLAPVRARPLVYVLAVLVALNRVESMADEGSDVRRVLLLVESGFAVAGLSWWLRSAWGGAERATTWLVRIGVLMLAVSAVAFVANVLGWAFLATTLMRGTGFSVQTGLAVVAGVIVVQSLLDVAIVSEFARRLHGLRAHGPLVAARAFRVLCVSAIGFWLVATLSGYGIWTAASAWLDETLVREWHVGSLDISIGRIGTSVLILVAGLWLARLVRFVLELDVLPRFKLEPGVDGAISGLTRYLIVGTGMLLSLASLGIDADQIALIAGALGVGVGFGLQGIVANFIAGLVLMLERPVRLGDRIQVGTLVGNVERIGLRSSTVRATDGSEVIVPNEGLISREVVNWTLSDRKRRVTLLIGVAYGTDPSRALEVIRNAVAGQAGVLGAASGGGPEPEIAFDAFGASSLDFVVKFWTAEASEADAVKSVVGIAVHDALGAAGIVIPFPQQDVHIVSVPDAAAKLVAKAP